MPYFVYLDTGYATETATSEDEAIQEYRDYLKEMLEAGASLDFAVEFED